MLLTAAASGEPSSGARQQCGELLWRQICSCLQAPERDEVKRILGAAAIDRNEDLHNELSALMLDLEAAYKSGTMGGGTFRQCSQARVPHAAVVGKLSKLEEEVHALVVYCAPGKRDGIAKKIAKYNEKCGSRIAVAWAAKEDPYPIE